MHIEPTEIQGLFRILLQPHRDERGYFVRTFDGAVFRDHGLCPDFPQHGASLNHRAGTIRGLHYQTAPLAENKVVRCSFGVLWDVVVDVRRQSPTYGHWQAFELSDEGSLSLYLSAGLAHGYQTLVDNVRVEYLLSTSFSAVNAAGVNYRDPGLAIAWPLPESIVSERDRALPPLAAAADGTPRTS